MTADDPFLSAFLTQSRHHLSRDFLPRIEKCVELLTPEEVWWRPNENSNSIGNLFLHLEGNVRQWIISGLGGAPDTRRRDAEFQEELPRSPTTLFENLTATVGESLAVLEKLPPARFLDDYQIQVYSVTGVQAVLHVVEHFSYHTGQIIYVTKLLKNQDLKFYDL